MQLECWRQQHNDLLSKLKQQETHYRQTKEKLRRAQLQQVQDVTGLDALQMQLQNAEVALHCSRKYEQFLSSQATWNRESIQNSVTGDQEIPAGVVVDDQFAADETALDQDGSVTGDPSIPAGVNVDEQAAAHTQLGSTVQIDPVDSSAEDLITELQSHGFTEEAVKRMQSAVEQVSLPGNNERLLSQLMTCST